MNTGEQPQWRHRIRSVLAGVGVIMLSVAGVLVPTLVDSAPQEPENQPIEIGAGVTKVVCPGSVELATEFEGGDLSYDDELGTGDGEVATQVHINPAGLVAPALVGQVGGGKDSSKGAIVVDNPQGPIVAEYEPIDEQVPLVTGMTFGVAESGDLRGLAAAPCLQPSASAWFVGGNTQVSSSAQLVLINPGDTPVRVTVRGWTGLGPIATETSELLEPNTSTSVLLETIERAERIAVHVSAEGGQVASYIQTSTLDGLTPGGVSYVEPTSAPSEESTLGPVALPTFDSSDEATLRVANPGESEAIVSVDLLGSSGDTPLDGAQGLTIDPGTVSEIPLAVPEAGYYAIRVRATAPVAAGVRLRSEGTTEEGFPNPPRDIAWLAAANAGNTLVLPVTHEVTTTLGIANPTLTTARVKVEVAGDDGELTKSSTITINAGSTVTVDTPDDSHLVKLTSSAPIIAAEHLVYSTPQGDLIDAIGARVELTERSEVTVTVTQN